MAEEMKNAEVLTEQDLEQVAGGTREEFEGICKALGKSVTSKN